MENDVVYIDIEKMMFTANGNIPLTVCTSFNMNEMVCLFGQSGSGKTMLLRMLAGLLQPDKGKIIVGSQTWFDRDKKINLTPQQRNTGLVFQDYALFPNMSVQENILYALPKHENKSLVEELMHVMELEQLKHRKPDTLSGGQKQRVALARALVRKPKLLLLDEPLSALDASIRIKLQDHLLKVHQQYQLTSVLVSHDIGEVFKLSDTVITIEKGKLIKQGHPKEVFINQQMSGKFQFVGEILSIEKEEILYVITILIANTITKVIATADEVKDLTIGDKVTVASKAFNPLIKKIG